jgi:RNA polymerase sigma-70 factor (ECF subfamily)
MSSRAQTAPAIPDEEIVRSFQETGSNDCFAELFVRHRKKVFSACRGFFADSAAAEDATQETFLRVYQKINSFQGGNFVGWLMRIAKNVCIDQWRRIRGEVGIEETHLIEVPAAGTLDSSSELRLTLEKLLKEMSSLPLEQRRCLEMKIEGYSYEETAARMGLSLDAVKSHLQNGRRMLWLKMEGAFARLR